MGSTKRARYFYFFWQTEGVSDIHIHPKYDETGKKEFDIALIQLETNQELQRNELWPICLPTSPVETESYTDTRPTVIGWGKLKKNEKESSARILQKLTGSVISQETCNSSNPELKVTIGGTKICFQSPKGAPCNGDSGGGMFMRARDDTVQLIGVCSLGPRDACMPGSTKVYTKVAHSGVLDWMRETMGVEKLNMENCGVTDPAVRISETLTDKVKCFFSKRQCY